MSKNYFIFMDESGNNKEDKYFSLGILFVPVDLIGEIYDDMRRYYDSCLDVAKRIKKEKVEEFIIQKDFEQLKNILKSSSDFELKFKNINFTNRDIYKSIIENYFKYKDIKFSCLLIDRENGKDKFNPWELYINRASMLICSNIKNFDKDSRFCLLSDFISKPKTEKESFENALLKKINCKTLKECSAEQMFGISRLESHSSLMIQLVDIMLGAVGFFEKEKQGLISEKSLDKKGYVANSLKECLGQKDMTVNFTKHKPNYFSVWYYDKK